MYHEKYTFVLLTLSKYNLADTLFVNFYMFLFLTLIEKVKIMTEICSAGPSAKSRAPNCVKIKATHFFLQDISHFFLGDDVTLSLVDQ